MEEGPTKKENKARNNIAGEENFLLSHYSGIKIIVDMVRAPPPKKRKKYRPISLLENPKSVLSRMARVGSSPIGRNSHIALHTRFRRGR